MPSTERLREIRDAIRALANDIEDREDLPTDDISLLRDTANELDELINNGNNMNSIYNDDITMTHKNNNKQGLAALSAEIIVDAVEEIANNADITGDERMVILEAAGRLYHQHEEIKRLRDRLNPFGDGETDIASLQAGLDSMSDDVKSLQGQVDDWRESCLVATAERDRLRVEIANRVAEIEILNHKINRLERCVIQNALNTSRLAQRDEEENDENIVFHAGRVVQNQIDHERHTDADNIGKIINDLENGEL
jgi:hypothetical protein